jgi:hypothetical protein
MKIERHGRHMRSIGYLIGGVILVGGLLSTAVGEAATYYVATIGSDQISCIQAQAQSTPKRTLRSGFGCLQPGDTLYIRAGTYNEGEFVNPGPGGTSWSTPVTIAGYPGDGALAVTLRAPGSTHIFTFTGSSAPYTILDNFVFDGTGLGHVPIKVGDGAHHIRVQNSEIKNGPFSGVLTGGTGNEFINLHIHNLGTTSLDHGIYQVGDHTLIQGCHIHDIPGYGLHNYDGGSTPNVSNNTIINNIIHDTGNAGILISSGNNNLASNNVSYHSNTEGIKLYGGTGARVYNNTFYNNRLDCALNSQDNLTFQNNICWRNGNDSLHQARGSATQSNNLFGTNPLFVNPDAGDFHLQSGSPAINAGVTLSEVTTAFDGASRPQGGRYDIGAYEYGGNQLPSPSGLRVISIK